jgi:hypothetical protein
MSKWLKFVFLAVIAFAPVAYAKDPQMVRSDQQSPVPEEGKAMVVFMRPSSYGGLIAASVYVAPDSETRFLGVIRPKQKVAVQMEPGTHRFMVIAENADFLDASLEAGKTYYVLISPRMGVWKARFSLFPLHKTGSDEYNLQSADFKEWVAKTEYVEIAPAGQRWYDENKTGIDKKKADFLVKWNKMAPKDRAELVLHAEDGVDAPL